jgi:hypothetical protein
MDKQQRPKKVTRLAEGHTAIIAGTGDRRLQRRGTESILQEVQLDVKRLTPGLAGSLQLQGQSI